MKSKLSFSLTLTFIICTSFFFIHATETKPTPTPPQPKIKQPQLSESQKYKLLLYPRTKDQINKGIKSIEARKIPKNVLPDQHKCANKLNIYRWLSGVDSNVSICETGIQYAISASKACNKAKKLSHALGDNTEKVNLHMNSRAIQLHEQIDAYMNDAGDNNREIRGHRMHCLDPRLGESGFASDENYYAMCVYPPSRSVAPHTLSKGWGYPGKGFYPIKYLHGNGWSYYPPSGVKLPKDQTTVKMWHLKSAPRAPFPDNEPKKNQGTPVNITATFPTGDNLVFEPEIPIPYKKGIYWIRIDVGDRIIDQYLVELF